MVSANQPHSFFLDHRHSHPLGMALPGLGLVSASAEGPSKKIRKPYTISKSRENWTEQEHDKFLEALQLYVALIYPYVDGFSLFSDCGRILASRYLQLSSMSSFFDFDRDWKKIEAFVGSKTVIQIRSHAQKYFLKVQKNGNSEHVPPPRPKRKAGHPYPQKASKNGFSPMEDSCSMLRSSTTPASVSSWHHIPPIVISHLSEDDREHLPTGLSCHSTEGASRTWPISENAHQANLSSSLRAMPDFVQVYSFIGSVFDPNPTAHLQKLKEMDPIDVETVLLLMRNLSVNMSTPTLKIIQSCFLHMVLAPTR